MPEEPSNDLSESPISDSPTFLLIWTISAFSFSVLYYFFLASPIYERMKEGKGDQIQLHLANCLLTKTLGEQEEGKLYTEMS